MGLFDILKKQNKGERQAKQYDFIQASGFRGFKKYHMTVYGDAVAEANNERLCNAVTKGMRISFVEGKSDNYKDPFLLVFLDGQKIGAIFDVDQVEAMTNGRIEAVYVKFEAETIVGNDKTITRHRARLFVKYCE